MEAKVCMATRAGEYFNNGFHCAEAVAKAVLESQGVQSSQAVAHATPFGGGMGKSFCETCGALSGGLIAIGHLHGRTEPGADWDGPAAMAKELRTRFLDHYGDTGCGVLRERFGERQSEECARLVSTIARETGEILVTGPVAE